MKMEDESIKIRFEDNSLEKIFNVLMDLRVIYGPSMGLEKAMGVLDEARNLMIDLCLLGIRDAHIEQVLDEVADELAVRGLGDGAVNFVREKYSNGGSESE